MRTLLSICTSLLLASAALAQEPPTGAKAVPPPGPLGEIIAAPALVDGPVIVDFSEQSGPQGFLTGNHNFDNFIGFISNPLQSIDPRAVTELWPMFGSAWLSANNRVLPSGDMQVYGAGLYLALSERLSIGLNQGGYAVANFSSDLAQNLRNRGVPIPDRDRGGQRQGWLNLGGFVQYTLIQEVPNQFLVTVGVRWEAPSGTSSIFQGSGPTYLAPYATIGKEFGKFHFLATTGYEFPVGSGDTSSNIFYANLHLDRQFGWFYPLVELNGAYHTTSINVSRETRHGLLDLGTFQSSGNVLSLAAGANAVLVPSRLEIGAVYVRPVTSQNRFDFNCMLVKMIVRY